MLYALGLTALASVSVAAVLFWARDMQDGRLSSASVVLLFLATIAYALFLWPEHAWNALQ